MQGVSPVFMEVITMITREKRELFYRNSALASNPKLMCMADAILNELSDIACDCHKVIFKGGDFESPAAAYRIEVAGDACVVIFLNVGVGLNVDYIITEREGEPNRSYFFHNLEYLVGMKYEPKQRLEFREFISTNQEAIYSAYVFSCQQLQEFKKAVVEIQDKKRALL